MPPYKTIVLHLLEDRPALYEQLRRSRTLLPTLNRLAEQLKTLHEAWMSHLTAPGRDPSQVSNETLELALDELVASLPSESPDDDSFPLDAAMAFITRPTPRA